MKYPAFDGTQSCAELGTDFFYPEAEPYRLDVLRPMCFGCSFLVECRDYALAHEIEGFWGGLTPKERRSVRRGLNRTVARVLVKDFLPVSAA